MTMTDILTVHYDPIQRYYRFINRNYSNTQPDSIFNAFFHFVVNKRLRLFFLYVSDIPPIFVDIAATNFWFDSNYFERWWATYMRNILCGFYNSLSFVVVGFRCTWYTKAGKPFQLQCHFVQTRKYDGQQAQLQSVYTGLHALRTIY